jgi:hypothetical protein
MNPQNLLKGRILEDLLSTLFKRAKYKVVSIGVEHQFPDVDALTFAEYKDKLPESLRRLPDLMVYRWDAGTPKIFFVEAKYRTELTSHNLQDLRTQLQSQRKHWANTYCVLAVANPPNQGKSENDYHQNFIRVIPLDELDTYPDTPKAFWRKANGFTKIFPEFESFMKKNPLVEDFGVDYAFQMEPLLDDSVKIIRALGSIAPRQSN